MHWHGDEGGLGGMVCVARWVGFLQASEGVVWTRRAGAVPVSHCKAQLGVGYIWHGMLRWRSERVYGVPEIDFEYGDESWEWMRLDGY